MDVIAEEELEIMADPVEVSGGFRANTADIDASNRINMNKVERVRKDDAFAHFCSSAVKFVSDSATPKGPRVLPWRIRPKHVVVVDSGNCIV